MPERGIPERGIIVENVRRSFGAAHAVRDVSFSARAGAVTGLVGPNGSGKTTLLLMLASLLQPDAGTIRINGLAPATSTAEVRAQVGWMPDSLGAWPSLTVHDTLVTTARLYDPPRAATDARATELLARVGLSDLAKVQARVLSRGQKQLLGLARSLVHSPNVLLLDEPASGLDARARVGLREHLRELAADGCTILISSHVLSELDEIVDDAVFIEAGVTVRADRLARASARERQWRVRVLTENVGPDQLAAVLGAATPSIRVERTGFLVPFSSDAAAAAGLRTILTAGIDVAEFAPALGDIEHTYLDLGDQS